MSLTRKIAHNTIVQIICKGGGGILSVIALALITRYLGREGYGAYTTIIAFLQFFGILANLGLITISVQMVSERDDKNEISKIMSNIVTIRLLSAVFFLGLAAVAALFFPYPNVIKIGIALTSFAFLFQMILETVVGVFQKNLRMDKPAIAEFISRVLYVLMVAALMYFKRGILEIMVALNIANFIWLALVLIFSKKFLLIKLSFDWRIWREVLTRAWPIGLSILLNLIYLKADIIILSLYKNQEAVGLYGAPYKLIDALTAFAMMFMGLILPLLASSWAKKDIDRFKKIFQKTFNLIIIVAAPILAGAYLISEEVMIFVAGKDFAESGRILSILSLGAGALFIGALFSHAIVAIDKQKLVIGGYFADAVLSLIGYFIFIPKYSYIGAAWVTVFSEVFIAVFSLIIIYRQTKILPRFFKIFLKSLLATIPMGIAVYYFKNVHVLVLLSLAAAVYAIFILLFRGITREEVREIVKIKS